MFIQCKSIHRLHKIQGWEQIGGAKTSFLTMSKQGGFLLESLNVALVRFIWFTGKESNVLIIFGKFCSMPAHISLMISLEDQLIKAPLCRRHVLVQVSLLLPLKHFKTIILKLLYLPGCFLCHQRDVFSTDTVSCGIRKFQGWPLSQSMLG